MKGRFPKFLKMNPKVLGLGGVEILILIVGMLSSQLLGKNSFFGLLMTLGVLALYKMSSRYIDFQAVLLSPTKRQSLEWMDKRRRFL